MMMKIAINAYIFSKGALPVLLACLCTSSNFLCAVYHKKFPLQVLCTACKVSNVDLESEITNKKSKTR